MFSMHRVPDLNTYIIIIIHYIYIALYTYVSKRFKALYISTQYRVATFVAH